MGWFGACYFSLTTLAAIYTFQLRIFHPNKTVNKKKSRNLRIKVSKISYSCIISKQSVAILPAKIQMWQMMMHKLSIVDGLSFLNHGEIWRITCTVILKFC